MEEERSGVLANIWRTLTGLFGRSSEANRVVFITQKLVDYMDEFFAGRGAGAELTQLPDEAIESTSACGSA